MFLTLMRIQYCALKSRSTVSLSDLVKEPCDLSTLLTWHLKLSNIFSQVVYTTLKLVSVALVMMN